MPKKVNLSKKFNWPSLSWQHHYKLNIPITPPQLTRFITKTLEPPYFLELLKAPQLKNIQGREMDHNVKELLFVAGTIPFEDLQGETPFKYRILSVFDSYEGKTKIVFKSDVRQSNLPNFLDLQDLAYIAPLKIERFRLGLEFFDGNTFATKLGFGPNVKNQIYIESKQSNLSCEIKTESKKKNNPPQTIKNEFFKTLNKNFQELFSLDLLT